MSVNCVNKFALFIASTFITMSISKYVTRTMKNLQKDYASVLSLLFKPIKLPSRHSTSTLTLDEGFKLRKGVFDELYSKMEIRSNCRVVHVAGTKGKGSTVEYISSSLIDSGAKVGIFTSPHMHTARERVRVGRELISHRDMIKFGREAIDLLTPHPWVVFFDLLVAVALKHFNEQRVEYMVLEAGIGGKYDTTNFVDAPAACVITSISLDHQLMLGNNIEEIAAQKAGIIKPFSHVFTPATQQPSVLQVFRNQCSEVQAQLHEVPVGRWVF